VAAGIKRAERLRRLPPYLFKEIDRARDAARARGVDIIDLGVGDPDLPTAPNIVAALKLAAENPANHRYPSYEGMLAFRKAAAAWYTSRFGVELDPEREVVALIGSKEGIAHVPLAFVEPGDVVLVPSPGYPVYSVGTLFAGGQSHFMPLLARNGFLPDLEAIPAVAARRARLIWVNYPNNPTSAVADLDFYGRVADLAREHDLLVCSDLAYSEMAYGGLRPPSFLELPGAKDICVEFHSLSKTYCMTGWRVGFAVGSAEAVAALGAVKSNIDSGVFQAVQEAAIEALTGDQAPVEDMRQTYGRRAELLYSGLTRLGLKLARPRATFYAWVEVPKGHDSTSFARHLLEKAGIVTTPGNGFGEPGEGFVRLAFTVGAARLEEAVERIGKVL
jgi:LL-diaminopimelate aminotransferase